MLQHHQIAEPRPRRWGKRRFPIGRPEVGRVAERLLDSIVEIVAERSNVGFHLDHGRDPCTGQTHRHQSPDKAYDAAGFVAALRERNATPHVAQNTSNRRSAIDGRTTRHPGYAISGRRRKRIEEIFGWTKATAGLRKTRHRGVARVGWIFTLTATAYNLVRLPKLLGATA